VSPGTTGRDHAEAGRRLPAGIRRGVCSRLPLALELAAMRVNLLTHWCGEEAEP